MSTHPALRAGAGAAPRPIRSVAQRRRPQLSSAERLDRVTHRLDLLVRDHSVGSTSHRETERQIGEAEAIAAELCAIFRRPSIEQAPVNPPLWQQGGKAIF